MISSLIERIGGRRSARSRAMSFGKWPRGLVTSLCAFAFMLMPGIAATAADLKTVRFGMTPKSFVESAPIIANQQGIFEKNGLKVELLELAGDVAILRAVVGMIPPGQADINPAVNALQTVVATKSAGQWRIVLFQNTPAQFHGRPELTHQLNEELRAVLRGE